MATITRAVLMFISVFSMAAPAVAQTRRVEGRLMDGTGGVLPGMVVSASAAEFDFYGETVTGSDGRYRLDGLPATRLTIVARGLNFADAVNTADLTNRDAVIDLTMELALTADVTVVGRRTFRQVAEAADPATMLVGVAHAASEGAVTAAEIALRPVQRAGEVLEALPGLVVSQHTGEGKANQYYLRGFNLDHGTDFATTIAGLPVNLPTHAHGHGYTDANFLIPELIGGIQYTKGGYDAAQGDFSSAGTAAVRYVSQLDRPIVSLSTGAGGWRRALAAASRSVGGGQLLVALERTQQDGPWTRPDDYERTSGVVSYSKRTASDEFRVTALGYGGRWNGTDQIPARAVDTGALGRFDGVDNTTGGDTTRAALVGEWQRGSGSAVTSATASLQRYDLDLFSNFTYALNDPVNGDQFHQADRRWVGAGRLRHQRLTRVARRSLEWRSGLDVRHDAIGLVGLYHTAARQRLEAIREDAVDQSSVGLFADAELEILPRLRATAGVRSDVFRFDVRAARRQNTGTRTSGLVSPKGGLVIGPWQSTELYVNGGLGFHSNDGRGTTLTVDPVTLDRVDSATPLVRTTSAEVGLRTVRLPRTQVSVAAWMLALDSEQLFVGDAGTTEAGRPSRRMGIELSTYSRVRSWLVMDADLAWTHARYSDDAAAGTHVPGAVGFVGDTGLSVSPTRRVFGSLRVRVLGRRALTEDGSSESRATRQLNLRAGVVLGRGLALTMDAFNVTNTRDSDIDYVYTSRLPGEPVEGVEDRHFHPALPRAIRLAISTRW